MDLSNFYTGIRILKQYKPDMCAEHDEIFFHVDVLKVSEFEIERLADLGFHLWGDNDEAFVWYV